MTELTAEQIGKARREASSLFWTQVVPVIVIAQDEFLKVYDECEERGLIRGHLAKWLTISKSNFDDFFEWLNLGEKRYKNLVIDYGIRVSKRMEKPVFDLYLTFKMYFDKRGMDDTRFKAQVEMAMTMIHLARDLWDKFFDLFIEKHGFDIREDYRPACMSDADMFFGKVANLLLQPGKYNLQPTNNYASIRAFETFSEKLLAPENIDSAGLEALKLNHFDTEVAQIERDAIGVGKLKEKYKVTIKNKH